jgi:hypothetical protein
MKNDIMKIIIDGVPHTLKVKKAIEAGLLTKETREIGDRFQYTPNGQIYVLAGLGKEGDFYQMALIGCETGHRWAQTASVENVDAITQNEWEKIVGYELDNFVKVEVVISVKK